MGKNKREVELLVISDVHLGTFGCRAKELTNYLKSVKPKTLVLNGDIVDVWQFNKRYFPKSHMKVIKCITSLLSKGTKVYYVTGNHDEIFRKFDGFELGGLQVVNKVVLDLDGKKAWIFHGDVFDVTMQHSKWLAKLGGWGYDTLIAINTAVNWMSEKILKQGRFSFSKHIKNSVKSAVKHINDFENIAAEIAVSNSYEYVVCGHIHQPQMRTIKTKNGSTDYLNSGDWIENLTALEYNQGSWSLYRYNEDLNILNETAPEEDPELLAAEFNNKQTFAELLLEFDLSSN